MRIVVASDLTVDISIEVRGVDMKMVLSGPGYRLTIVTSRDQLLAFAELIEAAMRHEPTARPKKGGKP